MVRKHFIYLTMCFSWSKLLFILLFCLVYNAYCVIIYDGCVGYSTKLNKITFICFIRKSILKFLFLFVNDFIY